MAVLDYIQKLTSPLPFYTLSYHIMSCLGIEFKPLPLSATEARLVGGITDLLANEPFEVTHSVLLHGFTACVVVKLKEGNYVVE